VTVQDGDGWRAPVGRWHEFIEISGLPLTPALPHPVAKQAVRARQVDDIGVNAIVQSGLARTQRFGQHDATGE
jgi:hypothetical protein